MEGGARSNSGNRIRWTLLPRRGRVRADDEKVYLQSGLTIKGPRTVIDRLIVGHRETVLYRNARTLLKSQGTETVRPLSTVPTETETTVTQDHPHPSSVRT